MEKWYLPITILPGVGLLIMSTSNLLNALSAELTHLIKEDRECMYTIIEQKITQLGLLNLALVAFYLSAASLVMAGLSGRLQLSPTLITWLMVLGIGSILGALALLTQYSLRAVRIKKAQFKKSLENQ